ncbi:MAG: glycosyltransferase family 39 protein [Nanoarchaeota archaeon]
MDIQKIKTKVKENRVLILVIILALIIRIGFTFVSPIKFWDETVYVNLGHDLSINPLDYSFANHGWSDFVPGGLWPKAGFRPPLLPYILSLFYLFKIDFLIDFLIPVVGALTVALVYLLGHKLFNKKVGLYSASLLAFVPVHVLYSGKVLNDVLATFFIVLVIYCFIKGVEENSKKYKIIFGFVLAVALLSRYTILWVMPLFPIYLLIRDKSFRFVRDKDLWLAILVFFLTLVPLFFYGLASYGNPLGAFIHGFKASTYWGGVQAWYFFLRYGWYMLSIVSVLFIVSLAFLCYSKKYKYKQIYLLLIWFWFFFLMVSIMPHKEDRFILPIIPAICLICGFFIAKIKRYEKIVFILIIGFLLFTNFQSFNSNIATYYNTNTKCFLKTMDQLNNIKEDFVTLSENPSLIYYFTHKESAFYPDNLNEQNLKQFVDSSHKPVYIVFLKFNSGFETEKWQNLKEILKKEYIPYYNCSEDSEVNSIYKNK